MQCGTSWAWHPLFGLAGYKLQSLCSVCVNDCAQHLHPWWRLRTDKPEGLSDLPPPATAGLTTAGSQEPTAALWGRLASRPELGAPSHFGEEGGMKAPQVPLREGGGLMREL